MVLPFDVQDGLQVAHMEALQLLQVSPVQGPSLTTVEKAGENDRPVHLELLGQPDVVLAQDTESSGGQELGWPCRSGR